MSVDSTPTETRPKSTAITRDGDTNDTVVHVECHTYRTVTVHISAYFNPSLAAFRMPVSSLSMLNPRVRKPLEVSAIVFNAQRDKVLLLQRIHAPYTWELPSCGIMNGEKTALHAVVRTVHQCSGQIVQKITRTLGFYEYESYPPLPPCRRYCFVVEVDHPEEEEVALWLELYQCFVWVTEDEVNEERRGSLALHFHSHMLRWILQKAFRAVREERQGQTSNEQKDTNGHARS